MTKYLIHTMPKRLWYVENYLIPSMTLQGIKESDIKVYNDSAGDGNLRACMYAFQSVDTSEEGTWHLQDDVIISHDFKEKTEMHDTGIVCGFNSKYDEELPAGYVDSGKMWFSFLCIRIPNDMAIGCAKWCLNGIIGNPIYSDWWKRGVNDDLIFRRYVWENWGDKPVLNLSPNIVDHIDYLIGGTVNSSKRPTIIRSKRWEDEYLVDALAERLKQDGR